MVTRIGPPQAGDFNEMYAATPPWEIGKPQPALAALLDLPGAIAGRVLDVGCGTAEFAMLAASRGFAATGIDSSPRAIEIAKGRATARGLDVRLDFRLVVGSALDLRGALGETFDTVVDSALFHVFDNADRARYVQSLADVVAPGGRYHVLVFSDAQPGDWGPRRVSEAELRASFAHGWRIDGLTPTTIALSVAAGQALAYRASLTRT